MIRSGLRLAQEALRPPDLPAAKEIVSIPNLELWEEKTAEFLEDIRIGLNSLKETAALDDQERQEIFNIKRQIVETLVEQINIGAGKKMEIVFRLNILTLLEQGFRDAESAKICSGTFELTNIGQVLFRL